MPKSEIKKDLRQVLKIHDYSNLIEKFSFEVKEIFNLFLKKGDEIRLVGGCVRDLILNKKVNDFDFATKLLPENIIKILEENNVKAIQTGIKFGTITAVINNKNFEITTLRKDLETNGRYCNPEFVDDYFLDAERRDFTINALYLDNKGTVYDYFDGIEDLKKRKVKFIGDAKKRIEEDYLRILRFFRFSCDYSKNLDEDGFRLCVLNKNGLRKLSRERIRIEFLKLISSKNYKNLLNILHSLKEKQIIAEIFSLEPDIKAFERFFKITQEFKIEISLELKIAILFIISSLQSPNLTDDNSNYLKISLTLDKFYKEICATNSEKKYLQFLYSNFTKISKENPLRNLKILLAFNNKTWVKDLYLLVAIKNTKIKITKEILDFIDNFFLPIFPLNGNYFKELGFREKEIGIILNEAKIFWAENDFNSDILFNDFLKNQIKQKSFL